MLKYYNAIILFLLVCSASNLSCSLLGIDSDITFPEKHHGYGYITVQIMNLEYILHLNSTFHLPDSINAVMISQMFGKYED